MASFTSKASGNWTATGLTTWNEANSPVAGDTVSIATGHRITVNSNVAAASITIAGTGGIDVTSTCTITLSSTVTNNGTGLTTASAFNVATGLTLALAMGTNTFTNAAAGTGIYLIGTATLSMTGNLTNSSSGFGLNAAAAGTVYSITGTVTNTSTGKAINTVSTSACSVSQPGGTALSCGAGNGRALYQLTGIGAVTITGNTVGGTGGSYVIENAIAGSTFTISGTHTGGTNGGLLLCSATTNLTINGLVTHQGSAVYAVGASTGAGTINLNGGLQVTAGTPTTAVLAGGTYTINIASSCYSTVKCLVLAIQGATVYLTGTQSIAIYNSLTAQISTGQLIFGKNGSPLTLSIAGAVTVQLQGTGSANASYGTINLTSDTGQFACAGGTININPFTRIKPNLSMAEGMSA